MGTAGWKRRRRPCRPCSSGNSTKICGIWIFESIFRGAGGLGKGDGFRSSGFPAACFREGGRATTAGRSRQQVSRSIDLYRGVPGLPVKDHPHSHPGSMAARNAGGTGRQRGQEPRRDALAGANSLLMATAPCCSGGTQAHLACNGLRRGTPAKQKINQQENRGSRLPGAGKLQCLKPAGINRSPGGAPHRGAGPRPMGGARGTPVHVDLFVCEISVRLSKLCSIAKGGDAGSV